MEIIPILHCWRERLSILHKARKTENKNRTRFLVSAGLRSLSLAVIFRLIQYIQSFLNVVAGPNSETVQRLRPLDGLDIRGRDNSLRPKIMLQSAVLLCGWSISATVQQHVRSCMTVAAIWKIVRVFREWFARHASEHLPPLDYISGEDSF